MLHLWKKSILRELLSGIIGFAFMVSTLFPSPSIAQTVFNLPAPGTIVTFSPADTPSLVRGITIDPNNPLKFDFIIGVGDDHLSGNAFQKEAMKLIKYFLVSLTVPENDMWVNLSPYEKDRIVPEHFGKTEMGRDLLLEDYMLKQLTAGLMDPEKKLGAEFWQRLRQQAKERFGTDNIPTGIFNKVWIVPDRAQVYVKGQSVYVVDSHLKVMLEEDYLSLQKHSSTVITGRLSGVIASEAKQSLSHNTHTIASQITREIILPQIEKEVNEGKNFALLRQIQNSAILAAWYKKNLKQTLLGRVYVDRKKTDGINGNDRKAVEKIYHQYLEAFKKGVVNYIKEDYDPDTQETVPRKYFSGGFREALSILGAGSNNPIIEQRLAVDRMLVRDVQVVLGSPDGNSAMVVKTSKGAKGINIEGNDLASIEQNFGLSQPVHRIPRLFNEAMTGRIEERDLGKKTGTRVSLVSHGAIWTGRKWPVNNESYIPPTREEIFASYDIAFKEMGNHEGLVMLDTAPAYAEQGSPQPSGEEWIGKYLDAHPDLRRHAFIATKFGEEPPLLGETKGEIFHDQPDRLERLQSSVERSLKHLGKIDLLYMHQATIKALEDREYMAAFRKLRDDHYGGIRFIGTSISDPQVLEEALAKGLLDQFDIVQIPALFLEQKSDLVDQLFKKGIGIVINSPVRFVKNGDYQGQYQRLAQDKRVSTILLGSRNNLGQSIDYFRKTDATMINKKVSEEFNALLAKLPPEKQKDYPLNLIEANMTDTIKKSFVKLISFLQWKFPDMQASIEINEPLEIPDFQDLSAIPALLTYIIFQEFGFTKEDFTEIHSGQNVEVEKIYANARQRTISLVQVLADDIEATSPHLSRALQDYLKVNLLADEPTILYQDPLQKAFGGRERMDRLIRRHIESKDKKHDDAMAATTDATMTAEEEERNRIEIERKFADYEGEIYYPAARVDLDGLIVLAKRFPKVSRFVYSDAFYAAESIDGRHELNSWETMAQLKKGIIDALQEQLEGAGEITGELVPERPKELIIKLKFFDSDSIEDHLRGRSFVIRYVKEDLYNFNENFEVIYVKYPGWGGRLAKEDRFWIKIFNQGKKGGYILVENRTTSKPHMGHLRAELESMNVYQADSGMIAGKNGGIDLNANEKTLVEQGDRIKLPVSTNPSEWQNLQTNGFVPVIISIQPATSLKTFLGLDQSNR